MASYDASFVGLYVVDIQGREIKSVPPAGQGQFIDEILLTVAGTAGGTVIDCSKFGLTTRAVGAVGDDEKADFIYNNLKQYKVDTTGLQRLPDYATSASMVAIHPDGERSHWHARGAAGGFTLSDKQEVEAAMDADFVHVGGVGLLDKFDGEPCRQFLEKAKAAGCTTTLDLIFARPEVADLIDMLMPYVDYFIPSIDETQTLTGLNDPDSIADHYLGLGAGHCLITLGKQGSFIASAKDDVRFRVPAIPGVQAVDATGCGDGYSAGIITALCQGWDLEFAAYFATTSASQVLSGLGSNAGIESLSGTLELAREHYERCSE